VQFPANVSLIDVMVLAQFQAVRTRERNITALEEIQGVSLAIGPKVFLITFKVIDVI
jgi:hypothetical protein